MENFQFNSVLIQGPRGRHVGNAFYFRDRHFVTAAHCVQGQDLIDATVFHSRNGPIKMQLRIAQCGVEYDICFLELIQVDFESIEAFLEEF